MPRYKSYYIGYNISELNIVIYIQGALYGGLISLLLVVYLGIMSQIKGSELKTLPTSMDRCSCVVNGTLILESDTDPNVEEM